MWSIEFVQVPDENKPRKEDSATNSPILPKKLTKSASIEIPTEKSAKERLQDFKDPDYLNTREVVSLFTCYIFLVTFYQF